MARHLQQNQDAPQGNELTQLSKVSSYQVLSQRYKSVQVVAGDIKVSGRQKYGATICANNIILTRIDIAIRK